MGYRVFGGLAVGAASVLAPAITFFFALLFIPERPRYLVASARLSGSASSSRHFSSLSALM